jgi:hypothetical protein
MLRSEILIMTGALLLKSFFIEAFVVPSSPIASSSFVPLYTATRTPLPIPYTHYYHSRWQPLYATPEKNSDTTEEDEEATTKRRRFLRNRVVELARNWVVNPMATARPMPQAVVAVLRDATMQAVDMAVDEVMHHRHAEQNGSNENNNNNNKSTLQMNNNDSSRAALSMDTQALIDEAFAPLEQALQQVETSLRESQRLLQDTKAQALDAVQAVQAAALAQAQGSVAVLAAAEEVASRTTLEDILLDSGVTDVSKLTFQDVDYGTSEMAPPFLGEDQCLVPGEPVVRVERAPENSRRIFAGVDIMASVDDVWRILTDYPHLQKVVPNLVVNQVLETYAGTPADKVVLDTSLPTVEAQCQHLAQQMKGAKLKQVGGAKVAGMNFSARTTLEVREWPQGLPDFAHFNDEVYEGVSRKDRARESAQVKLQRYRFPRPFAISSLPTRDISMQSIEHDDSEFRLYQGVWRMQPLPGCAPPGQQAMRLTYAVEISPRAYLPVQLVEGRIVRDLCTNLEAIRDYVAKTTPV